MAGVVFSLSPSVNVREIDYTPFISAASTSDVWFVGCFEWGPIDKPTLNQDARDLVRNYFKPIKDNSTDFLIAENYLFYGNGLRCIRVNSTSNPATNARADFYVDPVDTYDSNDSNGEDANYGYVVLPRNGSDTQFDTNGKSTLIIKNDDMWEEGIEDSYDSDFSGSASEFVSIFARYPGAVGNTLTVVSVNWFGYNGHYYKEDGTKIMYVDKRNDSGTYIVDSAYLDSWQNSPDIVEDEAFGPGDVLQSGRIVDPDDFLTRYRNGGIPFANDKNFNIAVIDHAGAFGPAGGVLEKFENLSLDPNAKDDQGRSRFYKDVINQASQFIYVGNIPDSAKALNFQVDLDGGNRAVASDISAADRIAGYSLIQDPEEYDVTTIITGNSPGVVQKWVIQNICEARADCVAIVSAAGDAASEGVETPKSWIETITNQTTILDRHISSRYFYGSSSRGIMSSNLKLCFDRYNNQKVWLPMDSDIAGLLAITDQQIGPWGSPMDVSRSAFRNIIRLKWKQPKVVRDELYRNQINPMINKRGYGDILLGDKTLQKTSSSFQYINVRRLFHFIEKSVADFMFFYLGKLNVPRTRLLAEKNIQLFLDGLTSQGAIIRGKAQINDANNGPSVINIGYMVADTAIEAPRSINNITLNFINTPAGIDLNEVLS